MNVHFSIKNYERKDMLLNILKEIKGYDYTIYDDCSSFELPNMIKTPYNYGKEEHWKIWNVNLIDVKSKDYDIFVFIPSDIKELDIKRIIKYAKKYENQSYIFNILNDGRKICWNNLKPTQATSEYFRIFFTDCAFFTNKKTLDKIRLLNPINKIRFEKNKSMSSGVGEQFTHQFNRNKISIFHPYESLAHHGEHISTMHPNERKNNPLNTIHRFKVDKPIYVGIATFKGREESLKKTIYSLNNQLIKPTKIFIYDNENSENLTDNGKFYKLKDLGPCYYFSCDDDLFYSFHYIEQMIADIKRHNAIITHHGRILNGLDLNYYRGHKTFRCLDDNRFTGQIDVAGTGVTAFDTDYFNPSEIYKSQYKRMSDLVFSLEAKRQGKVIMLTPHKRGFVIQNDIDQSTSCHATESINPINQNKIANEIYKLK